MFILYNSYFYIVFLSSDSYTNGTPSCSLFKKWRIMKMHTLMRVSAKQLFIIQCLTDPVLFSRLSSILGSSRRGWACCEWCRWWEKRWIWTIAPFFERPFFLWYYHDILIPRRKGLGGTSFCRRSPNYKIIDLQLANRISSVTIFLCFHIIVNNQIQ